MSILSHHRPPDGEHRVFARVFSYTEPLRTQMRSTRRFSKRPSLKGLAFGALLFPIGAVCAVTLMA